MKEKKSIGKRINDWWNGLTGKQQAGIVVGVAIFDGAIWGSIFQQVHDRKVMKGVANEAAARGYCLGQIDAYKEMAQHPYSMLDAGMKRLEQQGKVQKF